MTIGSKVGDTVRETVAKFVIGPGNVVRQADATV